MGVKQTLTAKLIAYVAANPRCTAQEAALACSANTARAYGNARATLDRALDAGLIKAERDGKVFRLTVG